MADTEFVDFEFDANFDEVKEFDGGSYALLPEREFIFEVANVTQKASGKGNPMVVVESVVAAEQDDDEAAAYAGQKAWTNYVLVPQSLGRLKMLMLACKSPMDKFRASAVLGAKYRGTIVHSKGDAQPGPDGTPRPERTFANITKERALDGGEQQQQQQQAAPPPAASKNGKTAAPPPAASKPAAAQQTRRA